jgi:hypothetical protein
VPLIKKFACAAALVVACLAGTAGSAPASNSTAGCKGDLVNCSIIGGMLVEQQSFVCVQDAFAHRRTGVKREEAKQRRQAWWRVANDFATMYIAVTKPNPKLKRMVAAKYCDPPSSAKRPFGSLKIKEKTFLYNDRAAERARLAGYVCLHPTWKAYVRVIKHMFYWVGDYKHFPEKLPPCPTPSPG